MAILIPDYVKLVTPHVKTVQEPHPTNVPHVNMVDT